jgi:transposase
MSAQNKTDSIKELELKLRDRTLKLPEYRRIQGVLLDKRGKQSRKEICQILGCSLRGLEEWVRKYKEKGIKGLLNKKKIGTTFLLSPKQKDEIKHILHTQSPKEQGVSEDEFWTTKALKSLVKKKYKVEYKSNESYLKLFKYANFSYQRVQFVDKRRDDKSHSNFKKRYVGKSKTGTITMSW